MEVIGLSGYARSGKDEAAKILVDKFGFQRVAFADKLREVLYQLNPIVGKLDMGIEVETFYVQDVIEKWGWDGYKETLYGPEIRRLLQRLGTEAGRETLWDSIWVDAAFAGLDEDAKVVITDVRFPNEAEAIKERGGHLWRITRTGIGPANSHPSETSLDDWKFDFTLYNDVDLEMYHASVANLYLLKKNGLL